MSYCKNGWSLLQKVDPKSDGASRDWVAIYDECSRILYEEIDYVQEAEYARDFAENFKGVPWVKVRQWQLSCSGKLTGVYRWAECLLSIWHKVPTGSDAVYTRDSRICTVNRQVIF